MLSHSVAQSRQVLVVVLEGVLCGITGRFECFVFLFLALFCQAFCFCFFWDRSF